VATHDLNEVDDLRILDFNGERAFRLFHMNELGAPIMYEKNQHEYKENDPFP
jgi:hypothetical protein